MNSFDSAFEKVCRLVDDFKENESHYLSPKYNEQQARKDYIDRLFIALGWDVNHTEQRNPYRQEVKVEETQINQRRPDYTFYIEPKFKEPKFFVEDVVFMNNALNTIEISGGEVDAFMSVKNFFKAAIKDIQDNKRSPADQVEYSVDLESARILLKFLERAKFSGSQAEKYKRFVDAIGDAANAFKKQHEQKQ